MNKMKICRTCKKEIAKSAKVCPYCGAKNKRSKLKIFLFAIVIFAIFIAGASYLNSKSNDLVDVVKTGYLGNYKSVSIGQVLEKSFTECKWDSFESDNNKNIVEADIKDTSTGKTRTMKIQFLVKKDNTFEVVFLKSDNDASVNSLSSNDAYSTKLILDTIYDEYGKHFDKSIVGNFKTTNDTLKGTPSNKYKK